MNANNVLKASLSRVAVLAVGLTLVLPAIAQQGDMQDMDMSSMPSMEMQMQHPTAKAKQSAKHAKNAKEAKEKERGEHPMSSSPRKRGSSDFASENPTSLDSRLRGNNEQRPKMQHLHFGNMIGVRPEPGGLAKSLPPMKISSMQGMDMSSMRDGEAPPDARSPDYSDGYRYTDMPGMAMSDHAKESMLLLDQFEYAHDNHGNNAAFLDGEFWYGEDFDKLWLKAEGEYARGKLEDLRTEALWNHAIGIYWGAQLGVREDFGEGPNRTWAAFGVQGLAPYWFDTEATFYAGENGRTAARVQFEYEELLTQKLILQPKFEVNLYGRDDPQRGIGSGLSDTELGLRLRYEFRHEFAPYIGVVWRQRYGRTADLYRAQGEPTGELSVVAGVRVWF